ncbi:hypothetical protein D083_0980 [Dickeya solani RNS 08.23.3.1.A]|nr:hypothetical protein D083_0980 [Dickeya solani RNS 08.23.3.1.A]
MRGDFRHAGAVKAGLAETVAGGGDYLVTPGLRFVFMVG